MTVIFLADETVTFAQAMTSTTVEPAGYVVVMVMAKSDPDEPRLVRSDKRGYLERTRTDATEASLIVVFVVRKVVEAAALQRKKAKTERGQRRPMEGTIQRDDVRSLPDGVECRGVLVKGGGRLHATVRKVISAVVEDT